MRVLIGLLLAFQMSSLKAHADTTAKEFIMSCTYGVLAGTLVGAASLAFTSHPGDHLNKVARGASLGLYAGIALGVYVVYIVPGMDSRGGDETDPVAAKKINVPVLIGPLVSDRGAFDGVEADWTILHF